MDPELEALRAKRMAEMQSQQQVHIHTISVNLKEICVHVHFNFSGWRRWIPATKGCRTSSSSRRYEK